MKNRILWIVTAIAVVFSGFAFMAPAANADTSDFHFTVKATSFDHAEQSATIKNRKRLLVNGAQQLTWENPNHSVKVTMAQVRRAPKIFTRCTASNRFTQSKQIFNKTHGARIVVLKPGSCAWNRGKRDNIRVGFRWNVKVPAVLVVDRNRRYRHAFNVVNGRLVKVCLNFIGGPVDEFTTNPVQVRYAQDVKYNGELEVKSEVNADVTFNITCPNGANFNTTIAASAFGYARNEITFTERTRVSVVNATRVSLNDSSWFNAEQEAVTNAKISITVEGSCGGDPTPTPEEPNLTVEAGPCVEPGQANGVISGSMIHSNDDDTVTFSAGSKSVTKAAPKNTPVPFTLSGFAPGTYTVTATLHNAGTSDSVSVTVRECEVPPHANPIAEIFIGEHAVDPQGTMPVFGRVKAFDGATAVLGSPVVTPSNLGGIFNWRTVAMERDGVTPCESGYVCYQGYFRAEAEGNGTLVATATDNKGGSFTTQPLQFKVVFIDHPET